MNALRYIPPVHIHPTMIVFILLAIVTGTFVHLLTIFIIVFIHEFGHYLMAVFFRWRINGIVIWLFGGVMDTDEHTTRPLHEEVLVTIAGPMQHVFIFIICSLLQLTHVFPTDIMDSLLYYNTVILVFNLLPIWPMDGGKLLFTIMSRHYPYKWAHRVMVISSIVLTVLFMGGYFLIESFSLSILFIAVFLLLENRAEWKRHTYLFIRFLLNKYEYPGRVGKIVPIVVPSYWSVMEVFACFRRESTHQIYVEFPDHSRRMINDMECLYSYFHDKRHDRQIADVAYYMG